MNGRWSAGSAYVRFEPLSPFMWRALPFGFGLMTVVNLLQLAGAWGAYRDSRVAVAIMALLLAMLTLIWFRSWKGIGPVLSAAVLTTGPAACLLIATQLDPTELTSPANWVSGFCVVPIMLLAFSRPLEELVLGLAALVVVQALIMANAGRSVRDLHAIVMSGGAGAAIGVGTLLLVMLLREIETVRKGLAVRERDAVWARAAGLSLHFRATESEAEAAEMLDRLASGSAHPDDPAVRVRCAELAESVRRDLRELKDQPLLLAELLPADGVLAWEIDDPLNFGQYFGYEDRLAIVAGLRSLNRLVPDGVTVRVVPIGRLDRVMCVVFSERCALPATPEWDRVVRRFKIRAAHDGRWAYQWIQPIKALRWEVR